MTDTTKKEAAQPVFGVLGAGSWGTALAMVLARNGHTTTLWGHHTDHMATLARERCNARYLPGLTFPERLSVTSNLADACKAAETLLVVVPSHAFRDVLRQLKPLCQPQVRFAWATKGLETGSGRLLHEVFADEIDAGVPSAVLSGPSFAGEVAKGLPTAITCASTDAAFAETLAGQLHNEHFRVYTSADVVGVELGGAIKNVYAIAAGISDGLGFGANTRAALITRALSEMIRLGEALGGARETFMGLAGVGDLLMTCTDNQSRNRRLGLALGQGRSMKDAVAEIGQVVEGAKTAEVVHMRAREFGIDMPIAEQVFQVLFHQLAPGEAVRRLLEREQKPEVI